MIERMIEAESPTKRRGNDMLESFPDADESDHSVLHIEQVEDGDDWRSEHSGRNDGRNDFAENMVNSFWNNTIDFMDPVIEREMAPFTIMEETQMSKIHFLFTMLNISQLIVINKGSMVGIITKNEFLKKRQPQAESRYDPGHDLAPPLL